jgi:DNA-binding MarR family transcriptional regulator
VSAEANVPVPEELIEDPAERLARSFKTTMGAIRRLRGRETHRPGDLSFAQYGLLFGLDGRSELPTSELAALADLSPATATQMLDHLEAAGLVTRVRSVHDKRVVLTSLSDSGRAAVAARRARFQVRWDKALAGFSDAELLAAAAVLDRLAAMFDELELA